MVVHNSMDWRCKRGLGYARQNISVVDFFHLRFAKIGHQLLYGSVLGFLFVVEHILVRSPRLGSHVVQKEDIVLVIRSWFIGMVRDAVERMRLGPSVRWSSLEYAPLGILSSANIENDAQ